MVQGEGLKNFKEKGTCPLPSYFLENYCLAMTTLIMKYITRMLQTILHFFENAEIVCSVDKYQTPSYTFTTIV